VDFLNSEISSCRSATRHVSNQVEMLVLEESSLRHLVSCIEHDVQSDFLKIETRLNASLPLPPTPSDLVKLCTLFEDKVILIVSVATYCDMFFKAVEEYRRGQVQHYLLMSVDMATSIAHAASTLAHHAVNITDIGK
jgi:hypothetical protein